MYSCLLVFKASNIIIRQTALQKVKSFNNKSHKDYHFYILTTYVYLTSTSLPGECVNMIGNILYNASGILLLIKWANINYTK